MKESVHFQQIEALNIGHFSKLTIVRYNIICHLLITSNDETHVFLNEQGKPKEYRHAWQIKNWLIENFKISEDQIEYLIKPQHNLFIRIGLIKLISILNNPISTTK